MTQSKCNPTFQIETPIVPSTGWSAQTLRIGRIELKFVHVHDSQGAFNFREFVDATIEGTSRKRHSKNATRYLEHIPPSVPTRLLSEEAADYLKDMERRKLSRTSLINQAHYFRLLKLATGDIPVSRISSDHIREFWDVIRWWPEHVGLYKKYKGLTDQEILKLGKASNKSMPSDATMELANRVISAFFNRLVKMRVLSTSPMYAFGEIKKGLISTNTRRCFTDEEMSAIFSEKTFLPWAKKAPHAWWAPMIGLYTGARVGEIAQLKISDITQESGMWCFNIRVSMDDDGSVNQTLKGRSSIRTVPIAQPLLEAGFLDFLEDAKASGHPRLFPQLKRGTLKGSKQLNGTSYGAALTRFFSVHLKRHHDIEKGLAFHCFRHSLITGLALNKVPYELIASITGHMPKERGREPEFPVMEKHYLHISTAPKRAEQFSALSSYAPPVVLPRYERGQFAHCFGKHAKKYP